VWDAAFARVVHFPVADQQIERQIQAHYRVMFGGFLERCRDEPGLVGDATAAFDVLVGAIRDLRTARLVREDDVRSLSLFVWATVHGIAMLAIDGQLGPDPRAPRALRSECGSAAFRPGVNASKSATVQDTHGCPAR
jgi:hypothetical protein